MKTVEELSKIKYLIIDIDGTLTDAGIYYDEHGNELKKFCTKDAAGFFVAKKVGIKTMILTGRECAATTRRMTEMKVDYLIQNCKDKLTFIQNFMDENGIDGSAIGYVGDDLNDLPAMQMCGFVGCPADACEEVKAIADYVAPINGGSGAFRSVVEYMMKQLGLWESLYKDVYGIGV